MRRFCTAAHYGEFSINHVTDLFLPTLEGIKLHFERDSMASKSKSLQIGFQLFCYQLQFLLDLGWIVNSAKCPYQLWISISYTHPHKHTALRQRSSWLRVPTA